MHMINFTQRRESWQPGLSVDTRDAAFEQMLDTLCTPAFFENNPKLDKPTILQALIEREMQRPTVVGDGIAFPHARMELVQHPVLAIATLAKPVLFGTDPVRILCLILVPQSDSSTSLKLMSQLSKILREDATREQALAAGTPEDLYAIFKAHNPRLDRPLLASDIMRAPRWSVRPEDPVSKCSHLMGVNGLPAVPVVNDRQEILGEITVERLFRYGLPDFFSSLKSVSFIAEFDPFEKYFANERNIPAGEIMSREMQQVPLDYTIMEIVFDLSILNRSRLYVVNDQRRWVGVIDKSIVLDNVINY